MNQQIVDNRNAAVARAESALTAAEKGNREMTPTENAVYDSAMAEATRLNEEIEAHNQRYSLHRIPNTNPTLANMSGAVREKVTSVMDFLRSGDRMATDTPIQIQQGTISNVADAVPTEVLDLVVNLNDLDPFAAAGARQIILENTAPKKVPIIYGAPAATVFLEGAAPTESTPFSATSWTLEGVRYSNLTKVSWESIQNVDFDLALQIVRSLVVGQIQSQTAAITTGLMAALEANHTNCFVDNGADAYDALINLITSVSPVFASPSNRFMLSRADLARLLSVRADGRPIVDPTAKLLVGFPYVVNDNLSRVLFGDFSSGVLIARTRVFVLRLQELYAEKGLVGLTSYQWEDAKFYASLAPTDQPIHFANLTGEGS